MTQATDSAISVASPATRSTGSDFAELCRVIQQSGLLRRRYGYYAVRCTLAIAAFVGCWVMFGFLGNSWWQVVTAVLLAVVSTQVAFIGHDAGHKQIFRGRRANDVVGLLHGGLVGMSYGWWVNKHSRHHANPNHEDDDPDLHIPLVVFTTGQAAETRGVLRWMAKYQAFLFFPLLLLEGLDLHWASLQAAWGRQLKLRGVERALLIAHIGLYLTAVFFVLSPVTGLVFIAVHQSLWGVYMGCSFAPNHKGMRTITEGHNLDFLRKQVLTSRNVRGGRWVNFLLGGLNFQIEHHLFPSMPTPHLRLAQPIIQGFCAEQGVSYSECGLFRSYGQVLGHLHAVGAPLRVVRR